MGCRIRKSPVAWASARGRSRFIFTASTANSASEIVQLSLGWFTRPDRLSPTGACHSTVVERVQTHHLRAGSVGHTEVCHHAASPSWSTGSPRLTSSRSRRSASWSHAAAMLSSISRCSPALIRWARVRHSSACWRNLETFIMRETAAVSARPCIPLRPRSVDWGRARLLAFWRPSI
jgi:hypothetical protein